MDNTFYVSLSGQLALRRQLDVIANNVANMNTTAYKAEDTLFRSHLVSNNPDVRSTMADKKKLAFVEDQGQLRNLTGGSLQSTGNSLDVAVVGNGYFTVETPNGVRYTRSGNMHKNEAGYLVNHDGYRVLDRNQNPLQFQESDVDVAIATDGTITTSNGELGKIHLVEFDNERLLMKEGSSLYSANNAQPKDAETSSLKQGMLEQSNVQPVVEMTKMINVLRAYQRTNKLIETDFQLQRRMIEQMPRLN